MFDKILIANRGEIAVRVIRTARAMGVRTVAVFSDVDARAPHVEMADEAVSLGGRTPAESYLRADAIIAAAQATGAEAIHPGYGFLSENPDFVEAVEAAGLTFIGPSAKAIRAMGLKDAAKKLMEDAGVPVVPGYHGADQDDALLAREAETIGYPVLIKAVAGGGGKGMRQVDDADGFGEALKAARNEARAAFGNDAVLIEKFVTTPRHIEIQVFGDGSRAVHLFERDCSLQRRHQKVIEEAPAPGMTDAVRAAMGAAAVRAAEAIGYAGAGTVEFIVDGSDGLREDGFWFMEMNTRLQVEHPVTEAITGVDLVEWQLRVASGEDLPATQDDLTITGHAFEARLYAEDVPAGFLPATGRLDHLEFPSHARADSGVRTGDVISPYYDPMIAKLIVHADDRPSALRAMEQAIAGTEVAGLTTNLAFLRALTRNDSFAAGDMDTGLIARNIDALTAAPAPCSRTCALAAAALSQPEHPGTLSGFALWHPLSREIVLVTSDAEVTARIETRSATRWRVELEETVHEVEQDSSGHWRIDGDKVAATLVCHGGVATIFWGNTYRFTLPDPLERDGAAGSGDAVIAPMPGLVREIAVAPGDAVEEGQRLAVLEAMKMEHVLRAPRSGTVAEISARQGDQVEAGALLVRLEAEA